MAHFNRLKRCFAHGGFVLLDNDPLGAGLFGGSQNRREILLARAAGTELKGGSFLCLFVNPDQFVHILGLLAGEVLEVNDGGAAGVLAHKGCRILAADLDPAGVKLSLKRGDGLVEQVEGVLAVEADELEVVVVIEQLYALGHGFFGDDLNVLNGGRPAVSAGRRFSGR